MPPQAYKGRGAVSRSAGRFASIKIEPDDGLEESLAAPATTLRPMQARSIISSNNSPDVPFDRSINPYQGCEHGCVYCYARPSHSYLDLSPGLEFETRIFYKPNAVEALLAAWAKTSYECKPITIGANTDPYQPAEKKFGITRKLLTAFLEHRHPVSLLMAPIIPAVNDSEIESILSRTGRVMSLLRQASGGKDYDNRFGIRQRGRGPYASMINQRFMTACRRHGIGSGRYRDTLDCTQFRPPAGRQMTLALD